MDPYSFSIDTTSELRLRRHLRDVLLPYARTHLTSDHVAFTEKVVEEVSVTALLNAFPTADRPKSPSSSFKLSSMCPWRMRHRFSFLQSRSKSSCVPCIPLTSHLRKRNGLHHRNTLDISGPSSLLLLIRKISRPRNAGLRTIIVCFFYAYTHVLT
jgi:hypothetical protein